MMRFTLLVGAGVLFGLNAPASSDVIFQHEGAVPPDEQGWSTNQPGPGVTVGPLTEPRGVEAWFVDDQSSASGSGAGYERQLSACQDAAVDANGWTLRTCLRIDDIGAGESSILVGFNSGTRRYDMWFTNDGEGRPVVELMEATDPTCGVIAQTFTVMDDLTSCHEPGFHLFELVFDPGSQTAALRVDGVEVITGYDGHMEGLTNYFGVTWGAGSSCAQGYGAFHRVEFEVNGVLPTLADLDCDGDVDSADLAILLGSWGPCPACPADITFDDQVDAADLAALLSAWS